MKKKYYVNRNSQSGGEHEIHTKGCSHPPLKKNRIPLKGTNLREWKREGKKKNISNMDGCGHCNKKYHTK